MNAASAITRGSGAGWKPSCIPSTIPDSFVAFVTKRAERRPVSLVGEFRDATHDCLSFEFTAGSMACRVDSPDFVDTATTVAP